MSKNRNYNYKDVDMTMASKTIVERFKEHLSELSNVRTNWTPDYADTLSTKIDQAMDEYLGIDPKLALREATEKVISIQMPAKRDLSFFKSQIEVDFAKDSKKKNEILKQLGFTKLLKKVQKNDQEALIQLLFMFKRHMNDKMKNDITEKGTDPNLIDNIISYANQLKMANTKQEVLKETSRGLTDEAITALCEIYEEVIGICKIASSYYMYEPLKKEQFSFSKTVSNMNAEKTVKEEQVV